MWTPNKLIDFKTLPDHKGSDVAFFLGCGDSINDITVEQWDIINENDVWTSNNFIYHPFVPDFYHVEMKSGQPDWIKLWGKRKRQKGSEYDDVKFIVNAGHCGHILPAIGDHPQVFGYPRNVVKNNKNAQRKDDMATHSNNASFTLVLDLLDKMKYDKTILFGVDLKRSTYFWTDTKEFGKTHQNTNKGLAKTAPHTTASRVPQFIKKVAKHWFRGSLYIGYKDSLLYDIGLKYIDIEKEI